MQAFSRAASAAATFSLSLLSLRLAIFAFCLSSTPSG